MTQKQKIMTFALATILIISVIAVTYAYFTISITDNSNAITVTTTQVANTTITSIKSTVGNPVYPGWVGYQAIDVTATDSGSMVYDLAIDITGGTNISDEVNIFVCKIEDTTTALAQNQITFTAATPQVDTTSNPIKYYMSGGSVTFPDNCTEVVDSTLGELGESYVISTSGGKTIEAGKHDRYYIKLEYENDESDSQEQGETFTITPRLTPRAAVASAQNNNSSEIVVLRGDNISKYVVTNQQLEIGSLIPNDVNVRTGIDGPNLAVADWEDMLYEDDEAPQFYLKLHLNEDDEITEGYVEFIINDERKIIWKNLFCPSEDEECETAYDNLVNGIYTLKGGDPDAYQDNLDVIKQAFNYEAQPDLCYDWSSCDITLCGLQFYVHPEGLVSIGYYDSYQCGFEDPGYFTCSW